MSVSICPSRVPAADNEVQAARPLQRATWSPYDDNGGTVLAIAGSDYCIVAGSTRMSTGYSILTRERTKLNQISPTCVIASAGFQADITTLVKVLKVRCTSLPPHCHRLQDLSSFNCLSCKDCMPLTHGFHLVSQPKHNPFTRADFVAAKYTIVLAGPSSQVSKRSRQAYELQSSIANTEQSAVQPALFPLLLVQPLCWP